MKHKSTWRPIFSKPLLLLLLSNNDLLQQFEDYDIELRKLHFKRSVVVPNHIFIAFNYQIYKLIVLKFYLTYIFSRNNNFRGFSNKMKNVKNLLFFSLTENNNVIGLA